MGLIWRTFRLAGEPPITRQMLRLIGKPFTIRIDKARTELGYAPSVDFASGIAAMEQTAARIGPAPAAGGPAHARWAPLGGVGG
jgi:nucleoside-diphosphate-sugar epimerase